MPSTRRTPPLPCRSGSASSVDALWGSLLARLEGPANRRFQRYASDPVAFVETVLGQRPWAKQAEILRAVAAAPQTTVRSSHGVGKTWVAACCALWWVYSHHPSLVLTTAPTARQVEGLLWAEINRLWHGANERRDEGRGMRDESGPDLSSSLIPHPSPVRSCRAAACSLGWLPRGSRRRWGCRPTSRRSLPAGTASTCW